jgi:hypothetical protein
MLHLPPPASNGTFPHALPLQYSMQHEEKLDLRTMERVGKQTGPTSKAVSGRACERPYQSRYRIFAQQSDRSASHDRAGVWRCRGAGCWPAESR